MKSVLLLLLLAVAVPAARAQTYYLDLDYQTLTVPHRTVAVEQVLDGRPGTPPIGIVYRGLGNKSAAVAFRHGVGPELTAFAQAQLPAQPTDHAIVLCLRSLRIGETINGTREQATAELSADVYEHLPTGYHFVRGVGSYASAYGLETTGRHAGHLAQLLSDCLNQLGTTEWAAVARQPARTLAELPADRPAPLAAGGRRGPAILRETPRRGLYYRLDHFLANRPDTVSPFVVDTIVRRYPSLAVTKQWLPVARVRPLAGTSARPGHVPPDLWGFSDGRQVFVRHEKQFYPLMRQGSSFTFVGEAPLDQLHAAAQAQKQVATSVWGGALGGALANTGIPDHTAEPMAYGLDLRTGAIAPYPGLNMPARADTAYLYVYRPLRATGAALLKVVVDGREMGTLGPGQYLEVPCARFGKPVQLCLNGLSAKMPCQYLVPNTSQLNYLRIEAAHTNQPWQWVPAAQGAADLDALDQQAPAQH